MNRVIHGTTIATNAVLEHKGARVVELFGSVPLRGWSKLSEELPPGRASLDE